MALLGNYTVLNKIPLRKMSGTTESAERSNFNTSGSNRNTQYTSGQTTVNHLYGEPGGYYPPYTWQMPQMAGALGVAPGLMVGSGVVTLSNLASGQYIAASLTGSGDITAAAITALASMASSITGSGIISLAAGNALAFVSASVSGSGSLSGTIFAIGNIAAPLSGSGAITTSGANATANAAAALSGSGSITLASETALASIAAAISGSGSLTGSAALAAALSASLSGSGSLTATAIAAAAMAAALSGSGDITTAQAVLAASIAAALSGSGDITTAQADMAASLFANLSGSGVITCSIVGSWPMAGSLTGTSSVAAAVNAIGFASAPLSGTGIITTAIPYASGDIAASIKSFSDLSPEGLAGAIWGTLAADFVASGTMGELLNTASSGGIDPAVLIAAVRTALDNQGYTVTRATEIDQTLKTGDFLALK